MSKRVIVLGVLLIFAGYASALVTLYDNELLTFGVGSTEDSTLDAVIDIAGNPGVQYDVTFDDEAGWQDIAIVDYSPTVAMGEEWVQTIKNVDEYYVTVYLFYQVDGWSYKQSTGVNLAPGAEATLSFVNPAISVTNSLGIKVGTNDWMNRPIGGTASVQVIPEPATLALLGLGGLAALRRRK